MSPSLRHQCRQPLFRGRVAPVQVLHRQHQRLPLTGVQEELPQQRKGPRPALLRAERGQGRRVSRARPGAGAATARSSSDAIPAACSRCWMVAVRASGRPCQAGPRAAGAGRAPADTGWRCHRPGSGLRSTSPTARPDCGRTPPAAATCPCRAPRRCRSPAPARRPPAPAARAAAPAPGSGPQSDSGAARRAVGRPPAAAGGRAPHTPPPGWTARRWG